MIKRNKQIIPICILAAIVLFITLVWILVKPIYEEYSEIKIRTDKNIVEKQNLEEKIKIIDTEKALEEQKFKALKPIYESSLDSKTQNLGVFGNMFEEIIKKAQKNGLLIRSIEYDMRPANDPIYADNAHDFNACELKFFFVGTYAQLQLFLAEMNSKFEYLMYISNLNVSAFTLNTDYLLINMSVNLYSKKKD